MFKDWHVDGEVAGQVKNYDKLFKLYVCVYVGLVNSATLFLSLVESSYMSIHLFYTAYRLPCDWPPHMTCFTLNK